MALNPLALNINPTGWRLFAMRKADPAFLTFRDKVFNRDKHTCQFCGFQARQYQEVVNLDQNYRLNKIGNLATACCFCAQCFFLEAVGKQDYGGGTLIHLPEMTQMELNGLCHVLVCAMANATSYRTDAQNIYRSLKSRSEAVEKEFGEGMSDPALFAKMLLETRIEDREKTTQQMLADLRLLPSRAKFNVQIEAWAAAAVEELASKEK